MMGISFNPSQWAKIMDPLVNEYNREKVGPAKNKVI
jgi:hypothetical protein